MEEPSPPAQRFSDQQLERIVDEATVYMCACPAQVAAAIRNLRQLHAYQRNCETQALGGEGETGLTVHREIAAAALGAMATLEDCLDRVLDMEGWDRQTLRMPEGLRRKRQEFLEKD